jgi:hypothetical protein
MGPESSGYRGGAWRKYDLFKFERDTTKTDPKRQITGSIAYLGYAFLFIFCQSHLSSNYIHLLQIMAETSNALAPRVRLIFPTSLSPQSFRDQNPTLLITFSFFQEDEVDPQFEPVIKLTEQVETKTHEEDEDVLFKMCVRISSNSLLSENHLNGILSTFRRAKLFRFDSSSVEWKERGTGDVRLLCHKATKKVRLVMRRDKTLKVCANHVSTYTSLTLDIYTLITSLSHCGYEIAAQCWLRQELGLESRC